MAYDIFGLTGPEADDQLNGLGVTVQSPSLPYSGINDTVEEMRNNPRPSQSANQYMIDNYFQSSTSGSQNVQVLADKQNDIEQTQKQDEMKQVWADQGISPTVQNSNVYRSKASGFEYQKVDGSQGKLIANAMLGYIAGYLQAGGSDSAQAIGAGAMGAYNMYASQEDMAHRFGQVDYLESKGYNPVDIQDFVKTGDRESLIKNKGKWQAAGQGIIFNPETGDFRKLGGAGSGKIIDKTIDLGDRVHVQYTDGSTSIIPKGEKPGGEGQGNFIILPNGKLFNTKTGVTSNPTTSGDIGLDDDYAEGGSTSSNNPDTAPFKDANGIWYVTKYDSHGIPRTTVAGPQQQKQLNDQGNAGKPSANQVQMSQDLDTLKTAAQKGDASLFTGQIVGRNDFLGDVGSSVFGNDAQRASYTAAQRIDGMMLSQGVADAKAMGASGINTKAEAEMYFRGMPRLDLTSADNLIASVDRIKAYTERFNARQGVDASQPSHTPSSSSGSYGSKYGY